MSAAALALVAAAVAVFAEGGYSAGPRVAFVVVAFGALALARPRPRVWRAPVLLILLALAGLGLLSTAWTVGLTGETIRWGLVTAAYAAVAAVSALAARSRRGLLVLAGGLAAIAAVTAVLGLVCAALGEPPFAVRIARVWRPAGPFEYPPALALLQASVLPILLTGVAHRSRPVSGLAVVGLVLAGGVLGLSASRASLALGIAIAGAYVLVRSPRAPLAAAVGLATAGAVVLAAAAELFDPGLVRLAVLIAVVAAAGPLWLVLRPRVKIRRSFGIRPAPAAAAVVIVAVLAGVFAFGAAAGRGKGPPTDFLHGRGQTWKAAVETFADRPFYGAGADAFLAASARHQDAQTIAFAHNLPLEGAAELGIAGLLLVLALYAATAHLLWRTRRSPACRLLGPAVAAFMLANLIDWPWHLAGSGAVWAIAVGALIGHAASPPVGSRDVSA